MNKVSSHISTILFLISLISLLKPEPLKCTICLNNIDFEYSIDAWGNTFHSSHEKEGLFCHSCSRIISKGVTNGGFIYPDGRQLCSLCHASVVQNTLETEKALDEVILQLSKVGINNISTNISISIVSLYQLKKIIGILAESKLKGYTEKEESIDNEIKYNILILNGLPKIEFKATLAHELLHVWLNEKSIILDEKFEEGFCNLGSYLIYKNNKTKFSSIHLLSMENNKDEIYGNGYRYMKNLLMKHGWPQLLTMLTSL